MSRKQIHALRTDRIQNRRIEALSNREAVVEAIADMDLDGPAASNPLGLVERPFTRHDAFISPIGHGGEYGHRAECATCGTVLDLHRDLESAFASVNQHVEWSLNPVLSSDEIDRLYDEALLEDIEEMERAERLEKEAWDWLADQDEQDSYAERDDHYFEHAEGEPWIDYVGSIEACREIFGGRDFLIIHANRPRL